MYAYSSQKLDANPVILGASLINAAVGPSFRISYAGSKNLLIGIKCSGVAAGVGITVKLQSSMTGDDWQDGNSVSVTANGWFYIRMNVEASGDQAKLPLANLGRLLASTGVGSAVTVDAIYISQGL